MSQFTMGEARVRFAELVNRAAYGKDRVILTRRGRPIAAVVPIEDLDTPRSAEGRDPAATSRLDRAAARLTLTRLAATPGHLESLAGIGRPLARRWPAPDEDWDEAAERAAGEDFLDQAGDRRR